MRVEHARFSGSIPAAYDRYLGPILFQPYAEDLAARSLTDKEDYFGLELACGTGILTGVLRTYLPSKVKLIATDLNEPMFRQAAGRKPTIRNAKNKATPVEIVGWAAPPRYDQSAHKLYWAKEVRFGNETENTLNYNIRILGRRGVLVLNSVAGMSQLPKIERSTSAILSAVEFNSGNRYADFNPASGD